MFLVDDRRMQWIWCQYSITCVLHILCFTSSPYIPCFFCFVFSFLSKFNSIINEYNFRLQEIRYTFFLLKNSSSLRIHRKIYEINSINWIAIHLRCFSNHHIHKRFMDIQKRKKKIVLAEKQIDFPNYHNYSILIRWMFEYEINISFEVNRTPCYWLLVAVAISTSFSE